MKKVWIIMDTDTETGSSSIKGLFENKNDAKLFLADYVIDHEIHTTYIELFERDITLASK